MKKIITLIIFSLCCVTSANSAVIFEYDFFGDLIRTVGRTGTKDYINSVHVGPDNNIYTTFSFYPSGSVNSRGHIQKHSQTGQLLGSINSTDLNRIMSLDFDSGGNLYVLGKELFDKIPPIEARIDKYDQYGNYVSTFGKFGTQVDRYNDIRIINDLIYTSSFGGSTDQMKIFDTTGNLIKSFSPTGSSFFHEEIAYDFNSGVLYVFTPKNGPGDILISKFGLDGNILGVIDVRTMLGGNITVGGLDLLAGLEVGSNGNIFSFNKFSNELIEFDANGNLLNSLYLGEGTGGATRDFTFNINGNILLARDDERPSGSARPVPEPSTLGLFGISVAGTLLSKNRKNKTLM